VSLQAARQAREAGHAALIDIRAPNEPGRGVAAGAKLLPMSRLRPRASVIPAQPVLRICNRQHRSSARPKALGQPGSMSAMSRAAWRNGYAAAGPSSAPATERRGRRLAQQRPRARPAWRDLAVPRDLDAAAFEAFLLEQATATGLSSERPSCAASRGALRTCCGMG
jgi:hypothetical protein